MHSARHADDHLRWQKTLAPRHIPLSLSRSLSAGTYIPLSSSSSSSYFFRVPRRARSTGPDNKPAEVILTIRSSSRAALSKLKETRRAAASRKEQQRENERDKRHANALRLIARLSRSIHLAARKVADCARHQIKRKRRRETHSAKRCPFQQLLCSSPIAAWNGVPGWAHTASGRFE